MAVKVFQYGANEMPFFVHAIVYTLKAESLDSLEAKTASKLLLCTTTAQ